MGEYLLEYRRVGKQVKVTACDPDTGREVSVFGPVSAARHELSELAVRKLLYVLKKDEDKD